MDNLQHAVGRLLGLVRLIRKYAYVRLGLGGFFAVGTCTGRHVEFLGVSVRQEVARQVPVETKPPNDGHQSGNDDESTNDCDNDDDDDVRCRVLGSRVLRSGVVGGLRRHGDVRCTDVRRSGKEVGDIRRGCVRCVDLRRGNVRPISVGFGDVRSRDVFIGGASVLTYRRLESSRVEWRRVVVCGHAGFRGRPRDRFTSGFVFFIGDR